MKVRDLMSSPVHTCRANETLAHAAQLLWEHDCGVLPVVDRDGRVGAAITDRDICMGAYTRGKDLAALRVADSMSRSVVTCRADEELAAAADTMVKHQLHRLPVVDEHGKPVGLLSLNDLAAAAARDPAVGRQALRVLTAVCTRRPAAKPAERALSTVPVPKPILMPKPVAAPV
jgi:CBS-domain-containing membrane protein